jgi:hypothetical protein
MHWFWRMTIAVGIAVLYQFTVPLPLSRWVCGVASLDIA